jgi:hypothetical protein
MFIYGTGYRTIFYFSILVVLSKLLPFYYLINEPIRITDIYVSMGVFTAFVCWLYINGQTLIGNIMELSTSVIYEKPNTPFMGFIYWITNK